MRHQTVPKLSKEIPVTDLEFLSEVSGSLLFFLKISINRLWVIQIVGDGAVDLRQRKGGIILANLFRSCTRPKGVNHAIKGNARASNAPNPFRCANQKIGKIVTGIHEIMVVQTARKSNQPCSPARRSIHSGGLQRGVAFILEISENQN